jgi:hypothetical protein
MPFALNFTSVRLHISSLNLETERPCIRRGFAPFH